MISNTLWMVSSLVQKNDVIRTMSFSQLRLNIHQQRANEMAPFNLAH